jgi:hypothetical protein
MHRRVFLGVAHEHVIQDRNRDHPTGGGTSPVLFPEAQRAIARTIGTASSSDLVSRRPSAIERHIARPVASGRYDVHSYRLAEYPFTQRPQPGTSSEKDRGIEFCATRIVLGKMRSRSKAARAALA